MLAQDVADYLKQHPYFFNEYASLLADMTLPHPHGGRAVSLSERQLIAMREKSKLLESKLAELLLFGEDNDAISEKVHRLALALLEARDLDGTLEALTRQLQDDFNVPHIALRIWPAGDETDTSAELKTLANHLVRQPYCGAHVPDEVIEWFGDSGEKLQSFAEVALAADDTAFGLLVFASADPQRFYPDMGTLYLKRISELVSAAVLRTVA